MNTKIFRRIKERIKISKYGCWEWQGARNTNGYGKISINDKIVSVHKAMLESIGKKIKTKQVIMHRCDNRCCCNPQHLVLGTQSANMRDMHRKGRHKKEK